MIKIKSLHKLEAVMRTWHIANGCKVIYDEAANYSFGRSIAYPDSAGGMITGGDQHILKAARTSNLGENTGMKTRIADEKLLRYLWENHHDSCFEQVHLSFTVICDLRTAMQMDTHRTWHKNRHSRRYSQDWVEFIYPQWRLQNRVGNKQGGDMAAQESLGKRWTHAWNDWVIDAVYRYETVLKEGMAREQAAYFLPTGVLTATFYTVDLRNLIGFIRLRCEEHAQYEVRQIAYKLVEMIEITNPWVHKLLMEEFDAKGWTRELAEENK